MLWNKTRMKQIHRNWQQLFPRRGYVKVKPNDTKFQNIRAPFKMDSVQEPGDHHEDYILAVYLQLHCLSILATPMGTSREEWRALGEKKVEKKVEHRSHCVEYLR
ncbi:hypothetical protein B0T26DRAFT_752533 [Lasiosphaeria miniovina]|uniref:Uncharacterized protein n=1 Tax=Lasiosphaeria miniovina TaxID=1954250 RepID=A0AA40AMN6_9PEZI|nr:uncharacterized protein B0T26DRAFT_752533 [Lasiosphaeria miniovina]KAK0718629.1 hypothetical protein B0T26DRAFT_752533 [Lasiosphaeria miniovina]